MIKAKAQNNLSVRNIVREEPMYEVKSAPRPSSPVERITELDAIIQRFGEHNGLLDNLLRSISVKVYKLHDTYEDSDAEKGEPVKEPRSVTEKLNTLLNFHDTLIVRAREINEHLDRVV